MLRLDTLTMPVPPCDDHGCIWCDEDAESDSDLCSECRAMERIAGNHVRECDCALCMIRGGIAFARRDR